MKKIRTKSSLFFALIVCFTTLLSCKNAKNGSLNAENLAQGTMTFSITPPKESNSGMMAAAMPKEGKLYFDHNKAAIEFSMMGIMTVRLITNGEARTQSLIIGGLGGKQAATASEADTKEMLDSLTVKLEETKETKEILGLTATKYLLRDTLKNTTASLFIAKDAPVEGLFWNLPIGNIKGLILGYEYAMDGKIWQLTATKIEPEKPKPEEFIIPKGCEIVPWKTLRNQE